MEGSFFLFFGAAVHTWIRVNRSAFKQHGGCPVGQGSVDSVAVSSDPADVGHAAKHIPILVAEDILGDINQPCFRKTYPAVLKLGFLRDLYPVCERSIEQVSSLRVN